MKKEKGHVNCLASGLRREASLSNSQCAPSSHRSSVLQTMPGQPHGCEAIIAAQGIMLKGPALEI